MKNTISKSLLKRIEIQQPPEKLPTRMRKMANELRVYRYRVPEIIDRPIDYPAVDFMADTLEGWADEIGIILEAERIKKEMKDK
jgi:hypothetical protein